MVVLQRRFKFRKGKQRELILSFMKAIKCSSQNELAEVLYIKRNTIKNWINETYTLPSEVYERIYSKWGGAKKFENDIKLRLYPNWGLKKGGRKRISKIKNLKDYYKKIREIKFLRRLEKNEKLKKRIKIKNKLVLSFIKEGIDLKCILATCLLNDGSLLGKRNSYRIAYYTKDETLKSIVYDLLLNESRYVPSISLDKGKGVYAIRVSDSELADSLLKLNPTYKKLPFKNQSKESYLKETQPSLDFLKYCNNKTRQWCIRFAFTADGSISLSKKGNFTLTLSCYHPTLCKQWIEILNLMNFKSTIIKRKSSWCKVSGVYVKNKSIPLFYQIGGFIDGVKISKKSKEYKGIEKNKLLSNAVKKSMGL